MLEIKDLLFLEQNKDTFFKVFIFNQYMIKLNKYDLLNTTKMCDVVTKENYVMYSFPDSPLLSDLDSPEYRVGGELHRVNAEMLLKLDKIHHLSDRREIELSDDTKCFTYITSMKLNNKKVEPNVDNVINWR